jgi:hypothetical protein
MRDREGRYKRSNTEQDGGERMMYQTALNCKSSHCRTQHTPLSCAHPIFMNPALDCMLTTTFLPPASRMPAARMAPESGEKRRGCRHAALGFFVLVQCMVRFNCIALSSVVHTITDLTTQYDRKLLITQYTMFYRQPHLPDLVMIG